MSPWFGKAIILASSIVMVIIRAPHGQRSRGVKVVRSGRGALEIVLLALAWLAFFVPLVWVAGAPVFAFADYPLRPVPLSGGRCLPRRGAVALREVTRGSRHELVDHARGAGKAPARHPGNLPRAAPPHVLGSPPLFVRPGARGSQLDCGPVLRCRNGPSLRLPPWPRGAHDAWRSSGRTTRRT